MSAPPTAIELRPQGAVTVIRFRESRQLGPERITQIDRELSEWLAAHPALPVVLDFSALQYVSSDFLAKLIGWQAKIKQGRGRLKLCGLGAPLQDLFEVTKLSQRFEIAADAEAAAASF
jgi:anti-anti-sigma factor